MKIDLILFLLITNLTSCTNSMNNKNTQLSLNKIEEITNIKLPVSDSNSFFSAEEKTMSYFLYLKFSLNEKNANEFETQNNFIFTSEKTIDFEFYNNTSSWWDIKKIESNLNFSSKEYKKGKWNVGIYLAKIKDPSTNEYVYYIIYSEEA